MERGDDDAPHRTRRAWLVMIVENFDDHIFCLHVIMLMLRTLQCNITDFHCAVDVRQRDIPRTAAKFTQFGRQRFAIRSRLAQARRQAARRGAALACDVQIETGSGATPSVIHIEADGPFDATGKPFGYSGIVQDVTERLAAQR